MNIKSVCFAQYQGSSACLGQEIQTWTDKKDKKTLK